MATDHRATRHHDRCGPARCPGGFCNRLLRRGPPDCQFCVWGRWWRRWNRRRCRGGSCLWHLHGGGWERCRWCVRSRHDGLVEVRVICGNGNLFSTSPESTTAPEGKQALSRRSPPGAVHHVRALTLRLAGPFLDAVEVLLAAQEQLLADGHGGG